MAPSLEQCRAIVETGDGPDRCTIYSTRAGDSLITTWISATEDGFERLEDAR